MLEGQRVPLLNSPSTGRPLRGGFRLNSCRSGAILPIPFGADRRDGLFQDAFWSAGFSISVVTRAPRKSTGSHRRHASRGTAA